MPVSAHRQEGNKQSLLAQLTRKHWSTISTMAKSLRYNDLTHTDAVLAVSDAVVSASLGDAAPAAPTRPPRSSSLDGVDGAAAGYSSTLSAGVRSRTHSFCSTARTESSASSRMQAAMYKIPTLESLFTMLPKHLAFDIEVKYPVEVQHRCVALFVVVPVSGHRHLQAWVRWYIVAPPGTLQMTSSTS